MGGLSRVRSRAPELSGRGWLGGGPLTLAGLRGRPVLLDFFTGGCVNCRLALREVEALEARFGGALQVVGVHSPKFPHEAEPSAVAAAVDRLGIRHPVLDDADHRTLGQYAVRAWPTLVLVGPDGRIEATAAGEGHGPALAGIVEGLLARDGGPPPAPDRPGAGVGPAGSLLRHPQGMLRLPDGDLLVADAGHRAVSRLDPSGERLRRRHEGFVWPTGVAVLPAEVAAEVGYDVVVADALGHTLHGLALASAASRRLAGTGERRAPAAGAPRGPGVDEALASPEDVAWWPEAGGVVVTMAGLHQLWAVDPRSGAVRVLAGTGGEQLRDGPAERALLAQPTALTVGADGALWWVDAESSALRRLSGGVVTTLVGSGLFAWGSRDGTLAEAELQHPQGVLALDDGGLLVCDTYNGALRRVDPAVGVVSTVARGLAEPVAAVPDGTGGWLVAESATSRLVRVP